jgi:hypothetical protein
MTPKALAFRTLVFFLVQYSMVASEIHHDIAKDRPTLVDSTHRANQVVSQPYYYTLTSAELGSPSPEAAIGNPLKGLMPSPLFSQPPYGEQLPHALEFYYIGTAMTGNSFMFDVSPDHLTWLHCLYLSMMIFLRRIGQRHDRRSR